MVLGTLVKSEKNSDYIKEYSCFSLLPFTLAVKAMGRSETPKGVPIFWGFRAQIR